MKSDVINDLVHAPFHGRQELSCILELLQHEIADCVRCREDRVRIRDSTDR